TWSPDGRKIAFLRLTRQRGGLYVMNADGSGERRLAPRNGTNPMWSRPVGFAWSSDGRMLAFSTIDNGNSDVYAIHADGSGLRNLSHDPAGDASTDGFPAGASSSPATATAARTST